MLSKIVILKLGLHSALNLDGLQHFRAYLQLLPMLSIIPAALWAAKSNVTAKVKALAALAWWVPKPSGQMKDFCSLLPLSVGSVSNEISSPLSSNTALVI